MSGKIQISIYFMIQLFMFKHTTHVFLMEEKC